MLVPVLRWVARITLIAAIIFMMMFSADVFEGEGTFGEKLTGLFMHNIPSLILMALLVIAWKRELAGGILLVVASLVMMFWFGSFSENSGSFIVVLPFLISGILFLIAYYFSGKKSKG